MNRSSTPLVFCAIAMVLAPGVARGQTQTPSTPPSSSIDPAPAQVRRPFRGLFGAPADPRASKQSLDLTFSAFGAYDTDVFGAETSRVTIPRAYQQPGWYSSATAGLNYARTGDRITVGFDGDAAVTRYPNNDRLSTMYRVGGDISARIAQRTRVAVAGGVTRAPQYRLGLFFSPDTATGQANPFDTVVPEFDLFTLTAYRSNGQVSLVQDLGRRASLSAFYSIADVNYTDGGSDYRSDAAGIRFSDRLTQHLGFHLGYAFSTANYSVIRTIPARRINNIDAGVDYGRAVSFSRRTTFSFSTGSAVVSANEPVATSTGSNFRYRFTGNAVLRREIARTWNASLGYRRGVDWHEGFQEPFLSDAVNAAFGGFMSRRLRFNSGADYTFGSIGFGGRNNGYDSGSAYGSLQLAISRIFAVFGRYVYYHYHFGSGIALDPRFVPALDRQGLSVGIEASVPIIR